MADKVTIIDVEIKTSEAVAALEELKKISLQQKKAMDEMVEGLSKEEAAQKKTTQEYIKANAEYKVIQDQIRKNEQQLKQLTASQSENVESLNEWKAEVSLLRKQQGNLNLATEEGRKENEKYIKRIDELNVKIKKNSDEDIKRTKTIGNYKDEVKKAINEMGGMPPAFGAIGEAGKKVNTVFSLISKNPLIATITILGGLLAGLYKAFTRTQDGADKMTKVMAALEAIFDTLTGYVAEFATQIVDAFLNPKQAISDFADLIENMIMKKVDAVIKTFGLLGKTVSLLFKGEFKEAFSTAGDAASTFIDELTPIGAVKDAIQGVTDGVKELSKELEAAAKDAIAVENIRIRLRKEEIRSIEALANSRKEFEKYKFLAEDTNRALEKRIEFAQKAGEIEIARAEDQVKVERLRLQLLEAELAATPVQLRNDEQLLAIARQKAAIAEAEAASFTKQTEIRNKANTLLAQQAKEAAAALEAEVQREIEAANKIAAAKIEADKKAKALALEAEQIDYENRVELLQNNGIALLELKREQLLAEKAQELELAEQTGADIELINEKYRQADIELTRASEKAKLSLAAEFAGNIAEIAGEGTAIAKAAAVAQTTISTYQGATAAFTGMTTSIPGPIGIALGVAAAAAAVVSGLANVKKILAVDSGLPGGKSSGTSRGSTGGAPTPPRSVTPSVGAGIVSRDAAKNLDQNTIVESRPTLVVDSVTQKQEQKTEENTTANI